MIDTQSVAPTTEPSTLRVGLGSRNYGYRRVCYDLPVEGVTFEKPLYVPWHYLKRSDLRLKNTYWFTPPGRVDLYHLWNSVCLNNRPWVSSFELQFPRYPIDHDDWMYRKAIERLHHPSCRRLLALSEFARDFTIQQNEGLLSSEVIEKLTVFYGGVEIPQPREGDATELTDRSDGFVMVMVGNAFFRKGGAALLRALRQLEHQIDGLKCLIVSSLSFGDYVTSTTVHDRQQAIEAIRSLECVELYENLPQAKVLELLRRAHVGVLTTLDDSFGWSILEAMSCGLPVITTKICATPEMVEHGVNGLQIELPTAPTGRWHGMQLPQGSEARARELEQANELIEQGLIEHSLRLAQDRTLLREMSVAAVEHVRRNHDPAGQARKLRAIYDEAI